ncbi:MAG: hypothetical protein A3C30_02910 [Candidatus Levybacteria bacterium RIFCSPHIGHO2_02_FULL_40_18]|nr:MAG: hypothetical protein A2869_05070 [Candidatus Levybacteria bacterium RIFCSPHIGHO2_01_FULL_40_58]OGH26925.1 MAG: hypothetical protein A3C30_02910 [Candidatus Levybacteria bacterium RIFCSPHIGHO2_02_FULL_40_18]OGH32047.1 MAG: hypothetical protein A3E43_03890 [Candidatus Levybacteria bacterium RIFCSPHIGHO2_12_FULL_40_31]OGH40831.1 MAG: hypothetical protein A2894_04510 [Candidatus Levybacteria bacterium RIFCSPLOWO2_01_FULL_40_64]OGH48687.1 MAG: hypothetical protein A3I54_03440 [Candidatus Lev
MEKAKIQKLSNGLTVITQQVPWVNSIAIYVAVNAGPRYESKISAGHAHFLEHMLFEGTRKYPTAKELAQVIESIGGKSGAWTDKEYIAYNVKVPKEYLEKGLYYLSEILFNPAFDKTSVEREKSIILEEIQRKEDTPEIEIWDLFMEYCWGKEQALGRSTLGERSTIKNIDPSQLRDYLNNFYYPSNMTISIVGKFNIRELNQYIQRYFGKGTIKSKREIEKVAFLPPIKKIKKIRSNSQQALLMIGTVTGIHYLHPDRFAMRVIADILGGGTSSRLFNKLVYELGIAYSTWVWNWTFKDTGMLIAYGGFSPVNVDRALTCIHEELAKLREGKIEKNEINVAKILDISNMYYSLETPDSIAQWHATTYATEGRILSTDYIKKEIEKVTAEDVKRVANQYFNQENFLTLVRGPITMQPPKKARPR